MQADLYFSDCFCYAAATDSRQWARRRQTIYAKSQPAAAQAARMPCGNDQRNTDDRNANDIPAKHELNNERNNYHGGDS